MPNTTEPPADATAAPPRARRFIIFIDNDSLPGAVRKSFFNALRGFVDGQLRPGDQAAVVAWSNAGLRFPAPLTDNKLRLRAAIDAVEASPSPSAVRTAYERVRRQCVRDVDLVKSARMAVSTAYGDCINMARTETMVLVHESRLLMNAINVAMTIAAGADGKKVLVLAGATLPLKPGFELFRWANMTFQPVMRGFDAANEQSREDEHLQREMLERLAKSANAHGVALYFINAPVAGDSLDMPNFTPGDDYGADSMRIANTDAAFGTLADMTGGLALKHPTDFATAFGIVAGDLEAYYSIGYRPADDIGRDRAVVVRTKNREYTVRTRQTYAPKTAEEQMRDRVVANIYSPSTKSEWPVTITSGAPRPANGGNFTVPVEVSVPPTLTLLPEEGKLTGGFSVYIAVGNKQGALSTISRSMQPVAVPVAEEPIFRRTPMTFGVNLTLKPGENLVSIAVADQVSRVAGFARTTIVTP